MILCAVDAESNGLHVPCDETAVRLTADELLLLRQRLAFDGPGTSAINSALDAKLYRGQKRLGRAG